MDYIHTSGKLHTIKWQCQTAMGAVLQAEHTKRNSNPAAASPSPAFFEHTVTSAIHILGSHGHHQPCTQHNPRHQIQMHSDMSTHKAVQGDATSHLQPHSISRIALGGLFFKKFHHHTMLASSNPTPTMHLGQGSTATMFPSCLQSITHTSCSNSKLSHQWLQTNHYAHTLTMTGNPPPLPRQKNKSLVRYSTWIFQRSDLSPPPCSLLLLSPL